MDFVILTYFLLLLEIFKAASSDKTFSSIQVIMNLKFINDTADVWDLLQYFHIISSNLFVEEMWFTSYILNTTTDTSHNNKIFT